MFYINSATGNKKMKAIFKGFTSVEKNATFTVAVKYKGIVLSEKSFELKDGINADTYQIGQTYDISEITK